jgi:hypothetical protein
VAGVPVVLVAVDPGVQGVGGEQPGPFLRDRQDRTMSAPMRPLPGGGGIAIRFGRHTPSLSGGRAVN